MSYLGNLKISLQALKPELTQKYHISSMGIFGSVLGDNFTPASDIDIIVSFSKPVGIEFIDLAEYLENILKRRVDLVSRHGIKESYFKIIEPDIIYV